MNEDQFLQLVSVHQGIIHKVCRLYRDTPPDREDLFQEIVFQLWRSIDDFRGQSKISTFIYRIALNTAIATFRTDRKNVIRYVDQVPEMSPENEDRALADRKDRLMAAIKLLAEGDRAIIALVLDEYSYREIAEIIGITENNVCVRVSRIKDKIRTLLTSNHEN
ncbi:sigma-70 family RNA polymerase sigma factor [Olivibacter sp. SA151]|uniref:RNA polymerase sigma factor n=1 Tax=Olivibacter jilunii TaxID=985016 RepID=UPI003F184EBD